jgi:hypothetical protein
VIFVRESAIKLCKTLAACKKNLKEKAGTENELLVLTCCHNHPSSLARSIILKCSQAGLDHKLVMADFENFVSNGQLKGTST